MAAIQRQYAITDPPDVEPEENWDDDFEFQGDPSSNSGSRSSRKKRGLLSVNQKLSVGSRAETEDWDADTSACATDEAAHGSVHLTTSTSTLKPPQSMLPISLLHAPERETENWDDDFEDARNSPQKAKPSFPPPRNSSLGQSSPTNPTSAAHPSTHLDEPVESWDDDLNDAEFGLGEHEEEDRTVTARSRRAALSRSPRTPTTPPPPTPKLPRGLAGTGAFLAPDQPFPQAHSPHSPTSSVFSVPATVRTTGSSAPLFASSSAGALAYPSASARVFSLLPPSPQVHKERERRRLRKRSRPGEKEDRERRRERDGVFELVEVAEGRTSGLARADDEEYQFGYGRSSIDSERDFEIEEEEEGRESAHEHATSVPPAHLPPNSRPHNVGSSSTRPSTAPTSSHAGSTSQFQSVPATPTKQTLLSRIGSVKRWAGAGVRRRRGMSTGPEDIAAESRYTDASHDADTHRTPRPHSSMSSFTNHDSNSSHSHHQPASQNHPYNRHSHASAQPRSPSSPASPSQPPKGNGAAHGGENGGGWFFRSSSRTSHAASPATSPIDPARTSRGFRSASRSTNHTTGGADGTSPGVSTSPRSNASPSPPGTRRLSRRDSGRRGPSADPPRTPRRATTGDRDAGGSVATPSSTSPPARQWNGVGVGRRPSSRGAGGVDGRKSIRASLDFNASRTSLGMSMNILEAQEREKERARDVYTPSPSLDPNAVIPGLRAIGRGRGYSVGGKGSEKESGKESEERTPAKLIKRKSLGFVQLGHATVGAGHREGVEADVGKEIVEDEKDSEGRHSRYGGLGIGRALGLGKSAEGGEEEERKRRKSFSRLLRDREKDDKKDDKDHQALPQTPAKDKEKEGSRGFMGSVRRLSLVGKHKRMKSGSGLGLASVPPSPSSAFFSRHASSGTPGANRSEVPPLPYALPPLPASSGSQLSLRLPPSSSSSHLPLPPHPLGLGRGGKRVVSTASSQSQGSSVLPASSSGTSTSASSSRNPSASHSQLPIDQTQDTPKQSPQPPPATIRRSSSRRSRASQEGKRRPSLASSRQSIDFEARIRRSIDQEVSESGKTSANGIAHPPLPPMPLLPPIELQPPSPPQTIGPASATGRKSESHETQPDPTSARTLGATLNASDSLSPTNSSSSLFFTPTSSPHPPSSPNKVNVSQSSGKSPGSPQSASLGRVAAATAVAATEGASGQGGATVPRRNSLGDLKIPARISQAQIGIKRDLGMVREFANSVDQLKELQHVYTELIAEVQAIFESHIQQHARQATPTIPRATSPSFFANLATKARPKSRARAQTNPNSGQGQISMSDSPSLQDVTTARLAYKEMASAFYSINSKYRISWECAELIVDLANGASASSATSPPISSASTQPLRQAQAAAFDNTGKKKSRERAITLAGDHSKPYPTASTSLVGSASLPISPPHLDGSGPPPASPPNMSWRASTGRHDLSQRQLILLREMLNNANATSVADDSHLSIPEESLPSLHSLHAVNKDWRWGDPRNSTITLPSEESSAAVHQDRHASVERKRKTGILGMTVIRDMLRAMKKSHTEGEAGLPSSPPSTANSAPMTKALHSTTSLSTQSSAGSKGHRHAHPRLPNNRRRARLSTGPETLRASQDLDRDIMASLPPTTAPFILPKPSARRPSLASIFRIGTKHRPPHAIHDDPIVDLPLNSAGHADEHQGQSSGTGEDSSSASEEDWDRIDSASDLDATTRALSMSSDGTATVRGNSQRQTKKGRSPYLQHDSFEPPPLPLPVPASSIHGSSAGYSMRHSIIPKRSFNVSSSSLRNGEQPMQSSPHGSSHLVQRPIRLSNVEEHNDEPNSPNSILLASPTPDAGLSIVVASPLRPSSFRSKPHKTGSVRSMPPQFTASGTASSLQDPKLAMTPENIPPLLENAKEVLAKLHECIAEIRALIDLATVSSHTQM